MMKNIITTLILFFLSGITYGQGIKESQSFWEVYKPYTLQFVPSGVDTIEFLKGVIQDPNSESYQYKAAARYLVLKNDISLRQFLISNMNNYPHKTNGIDSIHVWDESWDKYFTDQEIKGFLGIESAIQGMDSVARFHPNRLERIVAVRLLSRIGRLEYFDFIKSCYLTGLDQNIGGFLSEYGKDSRYANEVKELLTNTIQDSTKRSKIRSATSLLAAIDKPFTISILENKFRTTTGKNRYYNYFIDLGRLDPEGQMNRTMYAIDNESADSIKALFLPSYFSSPASNIDPKYYSPYFINFYKELISSGFYDYYAIYSYGLFKPYPLDLQSAVASNIDDLITLIDSTMNYTWIGDSQFKNELQNVLQSSKTNLQNGDSLACREDVKSFQDSVDFVYKDSLNADVRFVTLEGWKFLYWNAQYILDRLPKPPVVVNADIEVINPAMSLVNPGAFTMEIKGSGFSSSSVVYFNGNARTTTFNSDSTLNAEILSTDVSVAGNYPVWVIDGTTNSDTLYYSVVSTLPKPVRPVLECVTNNGDGTYTAFFGYKNDNSVSVYIPVGSKNKFTPTPQDRGQTTVFLPGRKYKVYTVNFNGSNLVWTLNGRTSTASSNSAPCQ